MDKTYEAGSVSLKWLGQMGFLIENDTSRVCIDYYASPDDLRQTPPAIRAERQTESVSELHGRGAVRHGQPSALRHGTQKPTSIFQEVP